MSKETADRRARLAEALRVNLRRRKEQARERAKPASDQNDRQQTGARAEKGREPAKP